MKFIRITLLLTLPITLLLLLGCVRTYADGYTEEVSWYTKTYDVIFGNPPREGNDTDNGLLPLIGLIVTATGGSLGWAKTFINKKNAEKLRDLAVDEKKSAQVRYQAAKDAVRDDTGLLSKVKSLAAIAAQTFEDQKEIYDKHGDTIDGVRRAYNEVSNKNS